MEKDKTDNLLNDNVFKCKVKVTKDGKESIKEVDLKPYSFAIQLKLMESGLINELLQVQKSLGEHPEENPEQIDFTKMGKMIRVSITIMHEMLPKEIKLTKDLDEFMEEINEEEPLRFVNWLMGHFGKQNVFLAQAPEVQGALKPEPKASVAK